MRRDSAGRWRLVLAGALAMAATTANFGADTQPAGGGETIIRRNVLIGGDGVGVVQGDTWNIYTMMMDVAGLSDAQRPAVMAELEAMGKDQGDAGQDIGDVWRGAGRKMTKQERAALDARVEKIKAESERQTAEHMAKIYKLLTPQQRARWETYKLDAGLYVWLWKIDLSAEQKTALKTALAEMGKEISELKDPNDKAALAGEHGKLWKRVLGILTEDQLGKVFSLYSPGVHVGTFREVDKAEAGK